MIIKGLVEEDLIQYKEPSMFIIMPHCSFKCDKEFGTQICQNSSLAKAKNIDVSVEEIINRYVNNPITKAVVFGGLEPFDDLQDVVDFIKEFRKVSNDKIVIYTGYTEEELKFRIAFLSRYKNIIVKFGRYIPNQKSHYDNVLGVNLASDNQYAKELNWEELTHD